MQIWMNLVLVLQLISALAMIGLVLVQHGKGADMGASFGSGASGSLFGATGSANFLSRSTAVCAAVFFTCTLAMAFLTNSATMRAPTESGSVLDRAGVPASAPSVPQGSVIPGAVPAPAAKPEPGASPAPAPAAPAASAGAIPTK
ncbi:preprotein translocase subunit SecG [Aquabacterium sp.]|uniref:preprotein translocase subunit SecG n=1 Tax=Aquabacterium sp. TaxID=1872578 RepID=UPI002C934202|nr:preprotein translocase subunit SecG [Aquabacterium sp.]HSW03274.1 preprotein translocase subunit SecG [Aquabacterium sp.]